MPKVVDKYNEERKKLLEKMFEILEINNENNKFSLHELDSNEGKKQQILDLEPEIKKYFICGGWNCFKDPNIKRKYLSFIKNVFKKMNYEIISVRRLVKDNNDDKNKDTIYNVINIESKKINVLNS
jgi:hypothetical protein